MPRQHLTAIVGADTRRFNRAMARIGSVAKRVGAGLGAAFVGGGIAAFKAAAQVEQMTVSLEGLVGGKKNAESLLDTLKKFSATTPFQLPEIVKVSKQLLASGVAVEDVTNNLKVLGDIAAGANVPLADMGAIYTKIANKGKASLEELNPLAERGIPIFQLLAKQMGVTREQVFKMATAGKISRATIDNAFLSMTSSGGIFADQMVKQSETVNGKISTLKDNIFLLGAAFGDTFSDEASEKLSKSIKILQDFKASEDFLAVAETIRSIIQVLDVALKALAAYFKFFYTIGKFIGEVAETIASKLGLTQTGFMMNQLTAGEGAFGAATAEEKLIARLDRIAENTSPLKQTVGGF